MNANPLIKGMIMQLSPEPGVCGNPMFAACLFVVDDPKDWGAQGYVQSLGQDGQRGGQAYYRATWKEMEPTGGMVQWDTP